jgi:hypothetical protein
MAGHLIAARRGSDLLGRLLRSFGIAGTDPHRRAGFGKTERQGATFGAGSPDHSNSCLDAHSS